MFLKDFLLGLIASLYSTNVKRILNLTLR